MSFLCFFGVFLVFFYKKNKQKKHQKNKRKEKEHVMILTCTSLHLQSISHTISLGEGAGP